jgi:hypothetical protein
VGQLPESHCWRQSMIMDDMGAGVWYHDRWVQNSLIPLVWAIRMDTSSIYVFPLPGCPRPCYSRAATFRPFSSLSMNGQLHSTLISIVQNG